MIEDIKNILNKNKTKINKFIKEYGILIGVTIIAIYVYKIYKDN